MADPWGTLNGLPREIIVGEIYSRLNFADRLSFRGVCHAWRSVSYEETTDQFMLERYFDEEQEREWLQLQYSKLMFVGVPSDAGGIFTMVTEPDQQQYPFPVYEHPALRGCSPVATYNSWWFVIKTALRFTSVRFDTFFYHPITKEVVPLPRLVSPFNQSVDLRQDLWFQIVSPPTTNMCSVFGLMLRNLIGASDILWRCIWVHGSDRWDWIYERQTPLHDSGLLTHRQLKFDLYGIVRFAVVEWENATLIYDIDLEAVTVYRGDDPARIDANFPQFENYPSDLLDWKITNGTVLACNCCEKSEDEVGVHCRRSARLAGRS